MADSRQRLIVWWRQLRYGKQGLSVLEYYFCPLFREIPQGSDAWPVWRADWERFKAWWEAGPTEPFDV